MQITCTVADNVEKDMHASLKLNFLFGNYQCIKSLNFLKKKKKATCISPVFLFSISFHLFTNISLLTVIFGKSCNTFLGIVRGNSLIQIEQISSDLQSIYLSGLEIQEGHCKVWARIYVILIHSFHPQLFCPSCDFCSDSWISFY